MYTVKEVKDKIAFAIPKQQKEINFMEEKKPIVVQ